MARWVIIGVGIWLALLVLAVYWWGNFPRGDERD